jgi:hypothetical protein
MSNLNVREYTTPSKPVSKDDENGQYHPELEKHRVEVEPKLAVMDESVRFEDPTVSRESASRSRQSSTRVIRVTV